MTNIYGVHIRSNPEHILDELDRADDLGINLVQLFVNPIYKNQDIYKKFRDKLINKKMQCVVHASYTINLAAEWTEYSWPIKDFIMQVELAHLIGSYGIVVHVGKKLDLSKEEGYNNMFTALLYVHNKTKNCNVKIFLETPAGQGSELCYKIEDLAYFFKKLSHHKNPIIKNRFRICIDTCHIFSAGYDISTKNKIELYLDTFEELIGIKNIALIHLNDSMQALGARVDRHESLGKGFIGSKGLKIFADFFKKLGTAIILETPDSNVYKTEIKNYLV
jgi:deoxyribonuclease-4